MMTREVFTNSFLTGFLPVWDSDLKFFVPKEGISVFLINMYRPGIIEESTVMTLKVVNLQTTESDSSLSLQTGDNQKHDSNKKDTSKRQRLHMHMSNKM